MTLAISSITALADSGHHPTQAHRITDLLRKLQDLQKQLQEVQKDGSDSARKHAELLQQQIQLIQMQILQSEQDAQHQPSQKQPPRTHLPDPGTASSDRDEMHAHRSADEIQGLFIDTFA